MNSAPILDGLLPALKRLDHLVGQAVAAMQARAGSARDQFRGLHIALDGVARSSARAPGAPLFGSAAELSADRVFIDVPSDSPRSPG